MKTLRGQVASRFGAATPNLATVEKLLLARTGLPSMAPGTLNVVLPERYLVRADAVIHSTEYFTGEVLKLQRCRAFGRRMIIMRPDSHEYAASDGANVLELVSDLHLRRTFGLRDGDTVEVEVEGDGVWWDGKEMALPEAATRSAPPAA